MASSTARATLEESASTRAAARLALPPTGDAASDAGVRAMWSKLLAAFPRSAAPIAAEPGQPVERTAFLPRCIVLQSIGAAFLVALWLAGLLQKPYEGENAALCWLITAMGVLGLVCVFLQRWRDVQWIATHVVRIGLLGTVIGLIIAFSAAATGDSTDPSAVRPMIAAVVSGMYVSLYATLLGIATNLWLKINLRVLAHDHG